MRFALKIVATVAMIVVGIVLSFTLMVGGPSATAAEPYCELVPLGSSSNIGVVCYDAEGNKIPPSEVQIGGILDNTVTIEVPVPGPTIKVTLPPVVEEITKIVRLPGPTQTVTVRPDKITETKTVRIPGPTATQTVTQNIVGPTVTRSTSPSPRPTATVTETAVEVETVTSTPTGQPTPKDATLEPEDKKPSRLDLGDGETTLVEVGLGALSLLGLLALLLLTLYGGYVLGWKDKERKDTNFMGALLDQAKLRRK